MAKFVTDIKTALTRKTPNGESFEPINLRAGLGALFCIFAAILGLVIALGSVTLPLGASLQIPLLGSDLVADANYLIFTLVFLGLLAFGLFIQISGYRNLSKRLETNYPNVSIILFFIVLATMGFYATNDFTIVSFIVIIGISALFVFSSDTKISKLRALMSIILLLVTIAIFAFNYGPTQVDSYINNLALIGPIFIIFWQLHSAIFVDMSKNYIGFFASILNGLFFPILSLGFIFPGFTFPIILAYLMLVIGQFMIMLFWWSPQESIREFARSTDTAKFAFGLTGLLTFVIGIVPLLTGPLAIINGVDIWRPWGSYSFIERSSTWTLDLPWNEYRIEGDFVSYTTYPWLISGFLSAMLFWIMLAPRLGAKELKAFHIREDIVKGGVKYLMILIAMAGIYASGQLATYSGDAVGFAIFLTICPSAIMYLMGALYAGSTDIITGIPLVITGIFIMVSPYVLAPLVIILWILLIITQGFLMIETKIRGFTCFQQSVLTVLFTIIFSGLFVAFLLGSFGAGPNAIWPANKWFNITILDIPVEIQAPTILAIVLLTLMVRNVALVGYSFGQSESTPLLGILSTIFALLIPLYAGTSTLAHQALTAAAIMFALYTISYILVLSQNLDLGSKVQNAGYNFEGQFIRVAMAISLAVGAVVALIAFVIFADVYVGPAQISMVITLVITLVTSLEILCFLTWLITGIRLNMLRGGFKFYRPEHRT